MSASAAAKAKPSAPKGPLTLHSSSVLSQDVVTSASILVDSTSAAPVAAFTNPVSAHAEALAVVNKQICHVTRDLRNESGWRAVPLFGGQAATQVAAGVAFQTAAYGFFTDDAAQLHATTLGADGRTWSPPAAVLGAVMSHPRAAYTPLGALVIYGVSPKGDLVTASQTGMSDPFTAIVHPAESALGEDDFQLCMIDEAAFAILARVDAKAYSITGDITKTDIVGPTLAPNFTATLKHVALGYASTAGLGTTAIFLLVAKDKGEKSPGLHCWSQTGTDPGTAVVKKVADASISLAAGHVSLDGSLHVYAVDKETLGLSVLHQSANQPWHEDGTPNWAPILLPLDKGIGGIVSDMNPAVAPSLFAIDGGDFSLRLHAQDVTTRMWKSQAILQHTAQPYNVTRHRAEIRVLDANARALAGQAVSVTVEKGCSAVEVSAGGRLYVINDKATTLTTDINGKLTVAIMATENGLACPNLVVACDGLPDPATVRPAGGLHEYLSGKGTLNPTNPSDRGGGPLPQFSSDGATLKTSRVDGKLLAPGANDGEAATHVATAIQHGAQVALGSPPPGVHGFGGSLVKGQTSFQVFHTPESLQAFCEAQGLSQRQLGSFWDELKHFFADIFEGIKNFVIKIIKFAVSVADHIVSFALDIAEGVGDMLHLDISGIEKAAAFMHGFFNAVDADIDKVVKWLEALFDFAAIWRTKMAIQQAVESFCPYVIELCGDTQRFTDSWFAKQKTKVNSAFDAAIQKYAGQSYGQTPKWQSPTAPPATTPAAGNAAPSDFTSNPHHNWLHDKVSSYQPDSPDLAPHDKLVELWKTVEAHLKDSGKEFQAALGKFKDAVWIIITDPASFATKAIPDFLDMLRDVTLAVLDLLDALIDAFVALIATGVDLVDTFLKAELPLGFLNTLWKWMAEAAGYPNDTKLNLYALGSLLAALPATLIYKLIVGVDHEPFPDGKLPAQLADSRAAGFVWPWQCVLTSDIVRIIQVIPADASNVLASQCPGWLTAVNIAFGGAIFVLRHGYPKKWEEELGLALLLSGGVIFSFTRAVAWLVDKWKSLGADLQNDIVAGLTTAYGLGTLGYAIYRDATGKLDILQGIAGILVPLTSVFSFLTLSPLRKNPEVEVFAIAGNVVFDLVSYFDGGLLLMYDTLDTRPKDAISAS